MSKPDSHHETAHVFLAQREHIEKELGMVRKAVLKPRQTFIDIHRIGADVIPTVIIDVLRGKPVAKMPSS